MTIKVTVQNTDKGAHYVEVWYVDANLNKMKSPSYVLGPEDSKEFWVHSNQSLVVQEV